jgi:prevent-host-death family protein
MGDAVGIRQLKNSLSEVLRRVKRGERVEIQDRGQPVALLVPYEREPRGQLAHLVELGVIRWDGGKVQGSAAPVAVTGPPVSDAVVEDRR